MAAKRCWSILLRRVPLTPHTSKLSTHPSRRCSTYNEYRNPLITRYASPRMRSVWSEQSKFSAWRRLWVSLAKAQLQLNVSGITQPQIDELSSKVNDIDFALAEAEERRLRHDVMAHVHAYGQQCPS